MQMNMHENYGIIRISDTRKHTRKGCMVQRLMTVTVERMIESLTFGFSLFTTYLLSPFTLLPYSTSPPEYTSSRPSRDSTRIIGHTHRSSCNHLMHACLDKLDRGKLTCIEGWFWVTSA
jgi:hypothetical protein